MNRFKTKLTLFMTMALFNMVHIQGAALPPSTHRHTKKDRQIWGVRYDRGAKILADMYDHPQGIEWSEQQTKKAMARMTEDYKRLNTYAATLMNDRHNPEAACQLDRLFQLFIKNLKESHNQLHFRDRLHARASKYVELPAGDVCFRGRNDKRGPDDSDDFGIPSVSVPTKLLLGKYNNYDSVNKQKSTALIRKLFGMIPADIVGQEQSADFQSTMKSYATSFYRRAMYANRHPNNEAISQEHDELITKENKLALEFRQEHPLLLKSKEFYPQNCEQIRKNLDATKELKKFLHGTNRGQKISQDVVRGTLQDLKPNVHIDTVQDFLDAVKVIEEIWKKENKILQDIEEIQTHIGGDVVHYLMDNKECLKPRFLNKLYSGLDADIDEKSSESSDESSDQGAKSSHEPIHKSADIKKAAPSPAVLSRQGQINNETSTIRDSVLEKLDNKQLLNREEIDFIKKNKTKLTKLQEMRLRKAIKELPVKGHVNSSTASASLVTADQFVEAELASFETPPASNKKKNKALKSTKEKEVEGIYAPEEFMPKSLPPTRSERELSGEVSRKIAEGKNLFEINSSHQPSVKPPLPLDDAAALAAKKAKRLRQKEKKKAGIQINQGDAHLVASSFTPFDSHKLITVHQSAVAQADLNKLILQDGK